MQPTKDGIERYCKYEAARRTTLPDTPGHKELSSVGSREFHVRDAVAVYTSQGAADRTGQPSVLEHKEDPGVVDAGVGSGKVRQKNTRFSRSARNMRHESRFNLENVIRHLPGRDASLR